MFQRHHGNASSRNSAPSIIDTQGTLSLNTQEKQYSPESPGGQPGSSIQRPSLPGAVTFIFQLIKSINTSIIGICESASERVRSGQRGRVGEWQRAKLTENVRAVSSGWLTSLPFPLHSWFIYRHLQLPRVRSA